MSPEQQTLHEPLLPSSEETETNTKDICIPAVLCGGRSIRVNHNVFLNLVLCLIYGISESLWNGTASSAYLLKIGNNKNAPLGNIEAVNGLASLLVALPVGYAADVYGRSKVIRAGGLLLFLASISQLSLLAWIGTDEQSDRLQSSNTALWIFGVIMALWGVTDSVVNGPAAALYADSTPQGQRSAYYTYLFAIYTGACSVGPIVSIILFQTLGDVWDLSHLRLVMYVGLGIGLINAVVMMLFDDRKALEEPTSCRELVEEETDIEDNDDDDEDDEEEALCNQETCSLEDEEEQQLVLSSPRSACATLLKLRQQWIPYIIFAQGLIFAIGSGMTVKFFPLFFKDEVGMSPSQVQVIYAIVPLVMVICSVLCSKLASTGFGRVQATLLFDILGVSLLFAMVFFKSYLDQHPFLLVPIYILRTSAMNASYPLQESILMDFVPKDQRARWKSLDSVAAMGWCGSAAFGGYLSDRYDYTSTFLVTAIVQSIGCAVFALALPLVPRHEGRHEYNDEEDSHLD
jgi:MFS family permease